MFSSGRFLFASSGPNNLFDKSSWAGVVPAPFDNYMNLAADRLANYVKYNSGVRSQIPGLSPSFSSWNGLRLHSANDYSETLRGNTLSVSSSGGKYIVNGSLNNTFWLIEGQTYTFDLTYPGNSGHPLRFSTTPDGIHNGGTAYTTGVTVNGTPGTPGSYVRIQVAVGAPSILYYYCENHPNMGGVLMMVPANTLAGAYVQNYVDFQSGVGFNSVSFGIVVNKFNPSYALYSSSDWVNIMAHELGHALGLGTFWNPALQSSGAVPPSDNFLDGSAYTNCRSAYRSVTGNSNYLKIPLEPGSNAHWDDAFRPSSAPGSGGLSHLGLGNELMVSEISPGASRVLSPVSIKALVDLGYEEKNPGASEGVPQLAASAVAPGLFKMNCDCGHVPTKVGTVFKT